MAWKCVILKILLKVWYEFLSRHQSSESIGSDRGYLIKIWTTLAGIPGWRNIFVVSR